MNTTKSKKQEFKTHVITDVKRTDNDVYRIAQKEYKDKKYVDLRIFYKSKEDESRLIPTFKGIWIENGLREPLIATLIKARTARSIEYLEEQGIRSEVIAEIEVSKTEVIRISKGQGKKNSFVDIRRFYRREDKLIPHKRKGISIQESALDEVIAGLIIA